MEWPCLQETELQLSPLQIHPYKWQVRAVDEIDDQKGAGIAWARKVVLKAKKNGCKISDG